MTNVSVASAVPPAPIGLEVLTDAFLDLWSPEPLSRIRPEDPGGFTSLWFEGSSPHTGENAALGPGDG